MNFYAFVQILEKIQPAFTAFKALRADLLHVIKEYLKRFSGVNHSTRFLNLHVVHGSWNIFYYILLQ